MSKIIFRIKILHSNIFFSVYVPDISTTQANYLGTYTWSQLQGHGSDNTKFKLYSDTPLEQDGYKKIVRISNGYEQSQPFLKGHLAPEGCYRGKWEDGDELYGFQQYEEVDGQQKYWRLYYYPSVNSIEYQQRYHDDNGWHFVERVQFNEKTLTWTN